MIRLKFQDKKLEDMTYSEILEYGKKWKAGQEKIKAEQKALAEKAVKE
jgi:sulfur transfer protein SufE